MKKLIRGPVQAIKSGWYLWLFPLIALAISGYFLYEYLAESGPRIHIRFEDAASVRAEKTPLRYRGVEIGLVKDIAISEDKREVVIEALLRKDASTFAVDGSKFSLVRPKVNFQGISGLETLIEGSYINVIPGKGSPKTDFHAEAIPATETSDDTSVYIIETPSAESLSPGDFVTYRGMRVGTITKMTLQKTGQLVNLQISIENRYAHLIRTNTQFWRKVGVQAKLGLFGSKIQVNSIDSIMNGALEFATPNDAGPRAKAGQKFILKPEMPKDMAKWNPVLE